MPTMAAASPWLPADGIALGSRMRTNQRPRDFRVADRACGKKDFVLWNKQLISSLAEF